MSFFVLTSTNGCITQGIGFRESDIKVNPFDDSVTTVVQKKISAFDYVNDTVLAHEAINIGLREVPISITDL